MCRIVYAVLMLACVPVGTLHPRAPLTHSAQKQVRCAVEQQQQQWWTFVYTMLHCFIPLVRYTRQQWVPNIATALGAHMLLQYIIACERTLTSVETMRDVQSHANVPSEAW